MMLKHTINCDVVHKTMYFICGSRDNGSRNISTFFQDGIAIVTIVSCLKYVYDSLVCVIACDCELCSHQLFMHRSLSVMVIWLPMWDSNSHILV